MVRSLLLCCTSLFAGAATLSAQAYFCNAGVHADAFLDWSKLPAPGPQPFTATIPVTGAPGLTATIAFPGVVPFPGSGALYSVVGNTNLLVHAADGTVTITFSQPVQGIRLLANTFGRFGHTFTM